MQYHSIFWLFGFRSLLTVIAILACNTASLWAADGRVLVVHSYHENFDWVQRVNNGLNPVMTSAKVDYRVFYMNTKRKPGEKQKRSAARRARRLLASFHPSVVIAVDDNAQTYFAESYVNTGEIQIIFCGVNANPRKYGYPAANATGILERPYPVQTLNVLKALLPNIHKVMVVSDNSLTSDQVLPQIRESSKNLPPDLRIVGFIQPATFIDWQQVITQLDQDPGIDALMIPLYHTVRQMGSEDSVASKEVMRWTLNNIKKPVVGLWPNNVMDGALLAVTVNPEEHGRVAAQMALEILNGKSAAQVPMVTNAEGFIMVNLRNKEHLAFDAGIDIDQIADQVIR